MPTQTFFNLPEDKRQALIVIALNEFANHDYANASISRIVAQANIAKGSIYQYFQDKKELYLYLVELASQEKITFLRSANPAEPQVGFFAYLRLLFGASAEFDLSHPTLSRVVYRAVYGNLPFRDQAIKQTKDISLEYIKHLVKQGIAQGDIDASVDLELAAFVINTLSNELGNFILERMEVEPKQLADSGSLDLDMQTIEKIFDNLIHVLSHGLGSKSSVPE